MAEDGITLKSTKAEILDALNQARARAEQLELGKLNPEKLEREKTEKRAVETAQKAVEQRNVFSQELNDKFNSLQAAIATEQARLQELYGVGRELQKLALVIEAQNERVARIDAEIAAKEEAAKQKLGSLQSEHAVKSAEFQAEHEAYLKKLKLERTREAEEHQYGLNRAREKENNAWEDEKSRREAALRKAEESASALLAEAEGKRDYVAGLEAKAAGVASLVEAERGAAVAETSERLQREFDHRSALAEKDAKSRIARLEDKTGYLEKELEGAAKSAEALQNKLDKAYSEMRDLATKTVESASGVKIIGNSDGKL